MGIAVFDNFFLQYLDSDKKNTKRKSSLGTVAILGLKTPTNTCYFYRKSDFRTVLNNSNQF